MSMSSVAGSGYVSAQLTAPLRVGPPAGTCLQSVSGQTTDVSRQVEARAKSTAELQQQLGC